MATRIHRILTSSALFVSLLCLGAAVASRAVPGLWAEEATLRFQPILVTRPIVVGESLPVEVAFENPSRRPIRVIGADTGCRYHACYAGRGLPITIPPGGRESFVLEVKGSSAGPFSDEIDVYTDVEGRGTISVRLVGEVIEPAGARFEPTGGLQPPGEP